MKKQVIILGAGISGLSCAYFLSKGERYDVTVLEKNSRAGGWINSNVSQGFLFEGGPRTFLFSKCKQLKSLAAELGLELILSASKGRGRYLWIEGKMRKAPILSLSLAKALLKEWRVPSKQEDESIWDFACRRFNPTVALHFFDPMATGIYAGNIRNLSVQACFPSMKRWEQEYRSVVKGLWKMEKPQGPSLFTFEKGVYALAQQLEERSGAHFQYGQEVQGVEFIGERIKVTTSRGVFEGDYLFSALPAHVAGRLLEDDLLAIPHTGATVVNLGYHSQVLEKKGFGYIVSSKEQEDILGVIFDSNIFPNGKEETRLTVMLKHCVLRNHEVLKVVLDALQRHLNITAYPDAYQVIDAPKAFPQMEVGHFARMQALEEKLKNTHPNLRLLGNYLYGVGIEDCVARAKSVAESFLSTVES